MRWAATCKEVLLQRSKWIAGGNSLRSVGRKGQRLLQGPRRPLSCHVRTGHPYHIRWQKMLRHAVHGAGGHPGHELPVLPGVAGPERRTAGAQPAGHWRALLRDTVYGRLQQRPVHHQ